jgi:MFS family permease
VRLSPIILLIIATSSFGYLAGDLPAAYILQRWPVDKAFAAIVVIWGVILACHAACSQFASLAALRFLLGFGEVFTAPTILQMFASWYTKEEQKVRLPIWYMCYGFNNIIGGLLAWCFYQAHSFRWQGLFICYGGITITFGFLLYFFVPASPTRARWLNEREKAIALERVRINKTGTEVWQFESAQLREAFLDPRLYVVFFLLLAAGLPTGGITVFGKYPQKCARLLHPTKTYTPAGPSIIAGFGFGNEKSTLLSMAPGAVSIIGVLVCMIAAKYTNRTLAGCFASILSIIGTIMMFAIPASNYNSRYGGYVLALLCKLHLLMDMS